VIAKEDTETSAAAIGKLLNLKELRMASEDLMKEVMPGVQSKDDREYLAKTDGIRC
jgi:prolyl-tRNA synthetase